MSSYVHQPQDVSAADEGGHSSGGLFGKLKNKTKKATTKIKAKLHSDDPNAEPTYEEEEHEDSPQTTVPESHATPYEQSKPSAFDAFKAPAAPASSYDNPSAPVSSYNSPAPVSSYNSPAPVSSYNPEDMAAGNLASDTNKYDAKIPEGIMKPKDFNMEGHDSEPPSYNNLSAPVSSYNPEDMAAGNLASDTSKDDVKIPEGIMKPKDFNMEGDEGGDRNSSAASEPIPSFSGLSLGSDQAANDSGIFGDATPHEQKAPVVADEGKDALAHALASAEKPEKDSSTNSMFNSSEDYGNRGFGDTNDTGADTVEEGYERTDDAFTPDSGYDVPGSATESVYQAKDNVKDKAADLNNVTDDSETYTQKAANTAYAVKDNVADTLGLNQPSEGPSVVDQAKDYAYRAKDTAAGYTGAATDTTKDYVGSAKDATTGSDNTYGSKAAELNDATDDSETYTQKATNTAAAAKDKAAETLGLNQSSTGPSLLDQAKAYMGVAKDTTKDYSGSATDTTKDYAGSATDTSKDYAGSAADTTKDYAGSATNTTKDYAGSAADTTKDYAGSAADTTKDYAGSAYDTSAQYAQAAKDKAAVTAQQASNVTKDYAGSAADTTKDYAGSAYDTSAQYAQAAKDKTAETAQQASGVTKDYAGSAYDTSAEYAQTGKAKAQDAATVAKDKTVEIATPGHEEKALSEKITEALSNLPFQAKEKTAVTAQSVAETTTDAAHEEAHKDTMLGKLTGILGFGKQPTHHDITATTTEDVAALAPHDVPSSGPTE